jgi:hypothetical protein
MSDIMPDPESAAEALEVSPDEDGIDRLTIYPPQGYPVTRRKEGVESVVAQRQRALWR